jgi:predicted nucleic acid-binding protein
MFRRIAGGPERSFTNVLRAVVDTNVLVYRHDPSAPEKQRRAEEWLRQGIAEDCLLIPWQVLVEFVSATTRPRKGRPPLLSERDAWTEAESLLDQFQVLLPDEETYRVALRGRALYGMPWFDAVLWAFAERAAVPTLWSEDFVHGRRYGGVEVVNPFR